MTPLIDIKLSDNWYKENQKLYWRKRFSLNNGDVVCLIGCNGAGKTTLLDQLRSQFVHKLGYEDCVDAQNPFARIFGKKKEASGFILRFAKDFEVSGSYEQHIFDSFAGYSQSTGEALRYKLSKAATLIGQYVKKAKKESKPLILLFDDCDVGTSIDMQDDIVRFIDLLHRDMAKRRVKHAIIVTANSYELCRTFKCIDCNTLLEKAFSSYEEYKKFVLLSRKRKNKREKEELAKAEKTK